MTKIKRNDPCPCGSGKKYKQCCMRKAGPIRRAPRDQIDQLSQVRHLAKQLIHQVPQDEAQRLQNNLDQIDDLVAYNAMIEQIDAASRALKIHRAAFKEMMADTEAAMERAQNLFSEERFISLRYTVQDVHRAFEKVGFPSRTRQALDEKDMEIIVDASLHLAGNKDDRARLTRQLMMALPEYVAAGRYLDGWLIQHSAYRMTEVPQESNPFLFAMFGRAFDEWTRQMDNEQVALLDALGLKTSEIVGKDPEKIEALLKAQLDDPKKKAELESYYDAHPMLYSTTQAKMWEMEHESLHLFERDDADCLYLSPEDVSPWVPMLLEQLEPMEIQARKAAARGEWDNEEILNKMSKAMADVAQEMSTAIFTPDRIRQLVAELKAYRRELLKKGEKEAAALAHAAWLPLDRDDVEAIEPTETPMLTAICFASLREMMIGLSDEAQTRAKDGSSMKVETEKGD